MQGKQKIARQLNWLRIVWCVLVKIVSIVIVLLMFRIASVEYMRDNIVMLDLFYNKMSFEKITEEPAIDELSLICKLISQLWIRSVVSARYWLCKVFSHGYSFMFIYREPQTQKSQKAPHHRLQTPSTEIPTPKNPIQDPTPKPKPQTTIYEEKWEKNIKNNPGGK